MGRPRWTLHAEAQAWRFLMNIGMYMHTYGGNIPPPPSFKRTIRTTIAQQKGYVDLYFYVPKSYYTKELRPEHKTGFPLVFACHGGGFTIGHATDDCRWANAVTTQVEAVVCCINYRLAPEHPFPTAVEDGVDAILYIVDHASELNVDPDRLCVSGFSSGGNMAFTVPLRWQYELRIRAGIPTELADGAQLRRPSTLPPNAASVGAFSNDDGGKIVAICAWYPSVDFTHTREERRMTNKRRDKEMPKFFTDLFDASYLYPPKGIDMQSPYLSPGVAPNNMLQGLPEDIMLYTCEWDALCEEGNQMAERLKEEPLSKKVHHRMIEGVGHAWDKSPTSRNPLTDEVYEEACGKLREVFYGSNEPLGLHS